MWLLIVLLQFFLELQHCILTMSFNREGDDSQTFSEMPSLSVTKSIQILRQQDEEYASLLGTVFDSVIEAFTSLVRDMESSLVQFIVNSVSSRCYGFKQEK